MDLKQTRIVRDCLSLILAKAWAEGWNIDVKINEEISGDKPHIKITFLR